MNSLKQDLEGKIVILDKQYLKPKYHDIKYRVFKVLAGFGTKPHTIGTALYGEFLSDGEQCRMEGYQVERLATDDEIALAQSALKDPTLANSGMDDSRYCFLHHQSVDEALVWLIANVDRNKIYD